MSQTSVAGRVERWACFELAWRGPADGNPFVDVELSATFRHKARGLRVDGFYDGGGTYRVRFMPDADGLWSYETQSNCPELDGQTGEFECVAPEPGNHGPVLVDDAFHFVYADGTPHHNFGTTSYGWIHQPEALVETTLATLREAPFTKLRMCVFPKTYKYTTNEPQRHPFEPAPDGKGWDYTRFNPAFFRNLEQRVAQVRDLGIEADIILFHPYDRWGYATMPPAADDRYLRHVIARLAAFRNVWWSVANEYDLMKEKSAADWARFLRIIQECDPYARLCSIHNCRGFYDHTVPAITHCSIQHHELLYKRWRETYGKPVIVDECGYEGNVPHTWGNVPAREMVHRFWSATVAGAYNGHSETYLHPEDIMWWNKGGVLRGESPARIAFLRRLVEEGPAEPFIPTPLTEQARVARKGDEVYLYYFGNSQPAECEIKLPADAEFRLELVDPWEMTVTPYSETVRHLSVVRLPGRPYLALRAWRVGAGP